MEANFFETADYADVQKIVNSSTEEAYALEFKRKSSPNDVDLNKDDRKLLGEVLSGFANATGGLLLLGIGTKNQQGIDRASAIYPIANVDVVADRYRAYANECVSPPVEGVKVRAISSEDSAGVIAIEVPKGQSRPHMSTAPGHHTYYRRVMQSFVPMQHYEIEEMIRMKVAPKITFIWKLRSTGSIGGNRCFAFLFGLRNESRSTAKFPFIAYLRGSNGPAVAQYGLDGNGGTLWPQMNTSASDAATFSGGMDRVIHPGQEFYVSRLDFNEVFAPESHREWGISKLGQDESLKLRFEFGCEDCPKEVAEFEFTREQLLATA